MGTEGTGDVDFTLISQLEGLRGFRQRGLGGVPAVDLLHSGLK